MTPVLHTVRASELLRYADSIERSANESLRAWIILGQTDRYGIVMAQARALRSAASKRSIAVRREILRNSGFMIA